MDQCPTCGRVSEDWASNRDTGLKGTQRADNEDRTTGYCDWRRSVGHHCYISDVDAVEWRLGPDGLFPVAVIELTRVDGNMPLPQSYLDAILDRFEKRDFQGRCAKEVARRLGVECFIVAFRWDLSEFWVYNLTSKRGWWKSLSRSTYKRWIISLGGGEEGSQP